jgi:hypothetical protein
MNQTGKHICGNFSSVCSSLLWANSPLLVFFQIHRSLIFSKINLGQQLGQLLVWMRMGGLSNPTHAQQRRTNTKHTCLHSLGQAYLLIVSRDVVKERKENQPRFA